MPELTEDTVLEALKAVYDPEIGVNIVDLGLVFGAQVDNDNNVLVTMTLTSMGCPLGPVIIQDIQRTVGDLEGTVGPVGDVQVQIVWSPPWSPEMMSEDAKDELGIW
jgi:metal-sulfur cluster biosynthetic enzyme